MIIKKISAFRNGLIKFINLTSKAVEALQTKLDTLVKELNMARRLLNKMDEVIGND